MEGQGHRKKYNTMELKIGFALIFVALIPLMFYWVFNNIAISKTFAELEEKKIQNELDHVGDIFAFKGEMLTKLIKDYAFFEDTYYKIEEKDKMWFDKNFKTPLYYEHSVDLALAINNNKEIIYEYGLWERDHTPLLEIEKIQNVFSATNKDRVLHGFITYDEDIYVMAIAPISPFNKGLKSNGILIFGKKLTPQMLLDIEREYGYSIYLYHKDDLIAPYTQSKKALVMKTYIKGMMDQLQEEKIMMTKQDKILSTTDIKDIDDGKIGELILISSRETYLSTLKIIYTNGFKAISISVVCILLLAFYLNKRMMKPLNTIKGDINNMTENQMLSHIKVEGPNEIMDLAKAFNEMVDNLHEEKKINEGLREKLEYDNLKTEFLGNISHELRTPLNVILGSIQLMELADRGIDSYGNQRKQAKVIKQNCYRLLKLANNLIDMTKIDSGFFQLNASKNNIVKVIEDTTLSVSDYMKNRDITLQFDTEVEEKYLICDPDKIERIILNLLSNAIKSTKPGGKIDIMVEDKDDRVIILIRDTGIGIPKHKQDIIFEKFRQVEDLLTRSCEGSGLGLPLTKALVEMHGGSISLESQCGKGSTFKIQLPVNYLEEDGEVKEEGLEPSQLERISIEFSDICCK
ncbi:sensor histidine kinase [Natronincola ferrireducens]|uniref:histidine kinase n=1 Tax=Natronincola ferrireducens TaxID=393762 RepID=A0A1G8YCR1_9FIRM|nr:ATP-binding protein [Natronincola ferrireducens]SDK00463.1 Signal transduction histidine kinase [Natronincola ferrireducens]